MRPLLHLAHEAKPALALVQLAVARAQVALHAPVGQRVPPAAGIEEVLLFPFSDAVARDPAAREPRVGREAGFLQQVGEEDALVGDVFPDLRQERGAPAVGFEDHAVLARLDLREQVGLVGEAQRLRRRKQRHLDAALRPFGGGHGREARVAERRGERVLRHVLMSARAGSRLPMQPRSSSSLVSVTKVAPAG